MVAGRECVLGGLKDWAEMDPPPVGDGLPDEGEAPVRLLL